MVRNSFALERLTSITDQPKEYNEADEFNIKKYEDGLTAFIKSAATPLTIALQGEWGSGKTSLMYTLKHRLCTEGPIKGIWLNTWEYSLMSNTEITLAKILYQIISKIAEISNDSDLAKTIKDKGGKIIKALFRTAIGFIANGDSSPADEIFSSNESTIGELRDEIKKHIDNIITKDKSCDKIVFFIDDLDRINPSSAVQLMELMKNIFTLEHCIFILAIDYEVVVKGLKPKFGDRNGKNEHEFRQFFDKIIQVPFSMPVTNYEVSEFVKKSLINVGYFDEKDADLNEYAKDILDLVKYSVGYNPRSIKRLINSASLVKCINGDSESMKEINKKFLNLAFIALQVVYPKIYNLLLKQADFTNWDEKKFLLGNNFKDLTDEYINQLGALTNLEIANDRWEQALKLICQSDDFLNSHFFEISSILNIILRRAPFDEEKREGLDVPLIEEILKLSMTTNTSSTYETASNMSDVKTISNIYEKLVESVPCDINFDIIETTDRNFTLGINYNGDQMRATIDTRKSGAEYLLDFVVLPDKVNTISKDKTEDLDRLRKKLNQVLNTSHKGTKIAVDRIKSYSNDNHPIPGVKIRICCNTETDLYEDSKINYIAKIIVDIAEFRRKCLSL